MGEKMRHADLGIADSPAPEWDVPTWFNLPAGTSFEIIDKLLAEC